MRDYFIRCFQLELQGKMFEVNPVLNKLKDIRERTAMLRGYL